MVINGNDVGDFEVKKICGQQDWLAIRSFSKEWWRLRNLAANFSPEDFLRSNYKKVRRSNTLFDRELQNCEKVP